MNSTNRKKKPQQLLRSHLWQSESHQYQSEKWSARCQVTRQGDDRSDTKDFAIKKTVRGIYVMILNSFTGNIWHLDVADSDKIGIKCLTYMGIFVSTTSTHSCLIWEMCSGTTRTGSFRRCAGVLSKARAPSSVLTSDGGTSVPYVMFILRFIWHTLSSK